MVLRGWSGVAGCGLKLSGRVTWFNNLMIFGLKRISVDFWRSGVLGYGLKWSSYVRPRLLMRGYGSEVV